MLACQSEPVPAPRPAPLPRSAPTEAPLAESGEPAASAAGSAAASGSAGVSPARAARTQRAPDSLPFEWPNAPLAARPGAFVLAPLRPWLDAALDSGVERAAFAYFSGTLVEAGPTSSKVKSAGGVSARLPNALVIALRPGESARVGDLLLTSFASGSGLQRAYVVGGSATAPRVRYVDLPWDDPTGWAQRDDTLSENGFQRLERAGEVGATVACTETATGTRRLRFVVVAVDDQRYLGLGFGGALRVLPRAQCEALPVTLKLAAGAAVRVPVAGELTPARVVAVDSDVGRVRVEVGAEKAKKELMIGFGNVAPGAP